VVRGPLISRSPETRNPVGILARYRRPFISFGWFGTLVHPGSFSPALKLVSPHLTMSVTLATSLSGDSLSPLYFRLSLLVPIPRIPPLELAPSSRPPACLRDVLTSRCWRVTFASMGDAPRCYCIIIPAGTLLRPESDWIVSTFRLFWSSVCFSNTSYLFSDKRADSFPGCPPSHPPTSFDIRLFHLLNPLPYEPSS